MMKGRLKYKKHTEGDLRRREQLRFDDTRAQTERTRNGVAGWTKSVCYHVKITFG